MIKLNSFEAAENHIAKLLVKSSKEKLKRENFNGALKDIEKEDLRKELSEANPKAQSLQTQIEDAKKKIDELESKKTKISE